MTREKQYEEAMCMFAHDLKNPLQCIEGFASLALRETMEQKTRESCLERIVSCSRWAMSLLDELTDLAAIEQSSLALRMTPEAINDIAAEVVDAFWVLCQRDQVQLLLRPAPEAPTVLADRRALARVLYNLLSNALKHAPRPGGRIEVSVHQGAGACLVRVADNGSGIAPAHRQRIFEKFYRADTGARGLGLGLYIARAIISAHGGVIQLDPEQAGQGAAFSFSLPPFDPERSYQNYKRYRGESTPLPLPRARGGVDGAGPPR